jgi:hypothetical protein
MRPSHIPTALLTAAVLVLQPRAAFIPTDMTFLPIYFDKWSSMALACVSSRQALPQSCFDLWKYELVFGCDKQDPERVNAQIMATGVGKGRTGGGVSQIKAMAGARDAVVTATWCCVFTDVTEVQNRVKNTLT